MIWLTIWLEVHPPVTITMPSRDACVAAMAEVHGQGWDATCTDMKARKVLAPETSPRPLPRPQRDQK